jgi:benzoyl-CoA reductase/2-hydroxyglutaryl-CoA dehydratase subunit BcrC/BadD/HgdB
MKLTTPVGLFNRLAAPMALFNRLPPSVLEKAGAGLLALRSLLPYEMGSALGSFWAPPVRPASVAFIKMLSQWISEARNASRTGKKVFLLPFNFPSELIHAFDSATPLTSEVLSTLAAAAGQGEQYWDMAMGLGLPDHLCSANTIELGSMLGTEDFKPQAIISAAPGGCDVNAKIHEFVAHHLGIPQFFLPKPPDDSGRGRKQYGLYMHNLIAELEKFLGEEMTEAKLRRVLEKANRCTELYYELWDLHKAVPCPVPNLFSLFMYGTRFTMWGTDAAVKTLETMVKVCKERLAKKSYPAEKEVARCLWAYTSYYFDFLGFFNWMEDRGYTHLGDGLDLCFPQLVDTSSRDSMIEGLAEAAWNMPMTRQVGAESMSRSWTEDVIYAARELKADCVIYCGHHSCKQTWSVVSILRSELTRRTGLPLLILKGDSWMKRMTPMSVIQQEIDEFIRNVVTKKPLKKRKLRDRKLGSSDAAEPSMSPGILS